MKSVTFAVASVLIAICFAGPARAAKPSYKASVVSPFTSFKTSVSADLVETYIDPVLVDMEIVSGRLDVDLYKKVLRLSLQPAMPFCPMNRACVQVMPELVVFELPIVSTQRTKCGDHITAKIGNRSSRGEFEVIRIIDYTLALCRIGHRLPIMGVFETQLSDSIHGGETLRTRSSFKAARWY